MGLSMEEQRILSEIEHDLAQDEPGLAARLSSLGRPRTPLVLGPARHTRLVKTVALLVMAAIMVLLVYTFVSLRTVPKPRVQHPASSQGRTAALVARQRGTATTSRTASRTPSVELVHGLRFLP